ncbi:hypothetical protein [Parabacteroides goldsteinii]|uniref:hypothetical protein n=1 Tax=Parabacteroides goldsteinii TaxID=328812 RepID=UPI00101DBCFA|nr:hypothetical protein [Parabacteroides goldsteinii]
MEEQIDIILDPSINSEVKYWMMRTMGGDFYKEFVEDGFIAIGYNEITTEDLKALPESDNLSKDVLATKLKDRNENITNAGYPASQILKFYRDMKVGDFVVVPGRSSHYVSFGIITSDVYEAEDKYLHSADLCPFAKRRTVNWKKSTVKFKLNPSLQLMFNSRHIISGVDDYAQYIDSLLNDFYVKDDETHLVLRINTEGDINAGNFFAIYKIFEIVDNFCVEYGIPETTANLVMKIQLESPGNVRLSSKHLLILGLVGFSILSINGGGLKINAGNFNFDLSTDGLIGMYNEYLDREVDRNLKESIKSSLDSLDMSTPQNMEYAVKLLEELNNSREKY